ncbi:MAG TPA: polyphosphate kinase 2 family protein [Acidimicrobiales bacterium]|nr:polyphosphate kinase 2 family protein [Acidimicrobiales bacterium]
MPHYEVTDGKGFDLKDHDPADTGHVEGGKAEGRAAVKKLTARLDELQETFYADGRYKLLVVLQGMDTSGKGGAIRKVFEGVDPSGVGVTAFKAPTEQELAHDFLWRIHPHVPGNGHITIFDRSHYEDVLIVAVHGLVPEARWKARLDHIRRFEEMLVDEGTVIRKFFLHISRDEQARRLQARLDRPDKHWKFRLGDLAERERWDDYQHAYERAIRHTATPDAPWYVVPADKKWHRDLVICRTLVETLEGLDLRYPPSPDDLTGVRVE